MPWMIAKQADFVEDGDYIYTLLEILEDGTAEVFFSGESLEKTQRIMSALEWQDVLGSGRMSLAQEGITFNANTGKIWKAPKSRRGVGIKIEPATKPVTRKRNP